MDEWDDDQLGAALRRRSTALPVGDVAAVGEAVRRRGRRRRVTRAVLAGGSAVLLVGAGALVLAGRDDEVVRSPATSPTVVVVSAPTVPSAPTTTDQSAVSTVPTPPPFTTPQLPPTSPPGVTAPAGATPPTVEYTSAGGSIRVSFAGGLLSLADAPTPSAGYAVEVEDFGRDRVRVRFEDGERQSRITVELVDGVPQPEIEED